MEFLNARTKQLMRIEYGMVEDMVLNGERFDLERVTRLLRVPLLIMHGQRDEAVPVHEAHALHAAAGERATLHLVPDAGHTFGAVHPWKGSTHALDEAIHTTHAWLQQLWADAPERAFVEKTSGAIIVLLLFLVSMNATAVWLRQRFERKL